MLTVLMVALATLMAHPHYKVREAATEWASWLNVTFDCRSAVEQAARTATTEEVRVRLGGVRSAYYHFEFKRVPNLTSMTGMNPGDSVWSNYFAEMAGGEPSEYATWSPCYKGPKDGEFFIEGMWDRTDKARQVEPQLVRALLIDYVVHWGMTRREVLRVVRETLATEDMEPLAGVVGGVVNREVK